MPTLSANVIIDWHHASPDLEIQQDQALDPDLDQALKECLDSHQDLDQTPYLDLDSDSL